MSEEIDRAFDEYYDKQRVLWRRMAWAYSAVFMVAAIAYGIGAVPVLALPCAWISGWCFSYIKDKTP